MVFLKLILLTYIAAWCVFVSGENVITCEGDVHRLACDTGLISVKSSFYGRTDNHTCGINWSTYEAVNTSCSLRVHTIADRCNGLKECEIKTDFLANDDPCYGTYKYFNTTYVCTNGRVDVICERGYSTLDCGDGTIHIINANFGRADSATCSNGLSNSVLQNTNCYAPNTLTTVAELCDGQSRCTVEASSTIFSNPCTETVKYLTVSYMCTRLTVTCEHDTAVLTCGAQHLKIISANYGRTDSATCSSQRPANQISYTNCYMPETLNIVAARCEGKSSCAVPASNGLFSDPCVGTFKYLTVMYACV
ncbi:rhamnose-binding lectin-like [Clarias gariepinus]|uniref:rhamnose-binding lectin-like n=1 Tax=Clarias gariepinus TaxID=13013 RepID=UPI00234D5940|nr:rhamnose-binding lectin-like [Clarias gariepinus]